MNMLVGVKWDQRQILEDDLSRFIRSDSYTNSIAYYLLTGRKGAHVYSADQTYVVICKHPHIDDRLLVFPEINGDGTLTVQVLQNLEVPRNGVQLARYTEQDLANLQQASQSVISCKKITVMEIPEDVLDWKYPIQILDTTRTGGMHGKKMHVVRNKFNRVADRLTILPLTDPVSIRAMEAAVMFWAGYMKFYNKETGHSLTEFYDHLIDAIKVRPDMFDGFVTMDGEEPAGFMVWDQAHNDTVNAIAGLSRRSIKGMSEFQTVAACRILSGQGIRHYNLGGSETETLDRHKRLFDPVASVKIKSFDVRITNSLMSKIKKTPLTLS